MKYSVTFCLLIFLSFGNILYAQNIKKTYIDSVLSAKIERREIKVDKDINKLAQKIFRLPQSEAVKAYKYIDSTYRESDYIRINTLDNFASTHQRIGNLYISKDLNIIGLNLAKKYDSKFFLYQYNELLSYHYFDRSINDSAVYYINEAEKVVFENPKTLGRYWPTIYNRKSQIEGQLGNYEKRDYYMDQSIVALDTIDNHPSKAYFLGNVVYHYKFTKNYEKHAFYANKLKEYYLKNNDYSLPELHTSITSILAFDDSENYIKELKSLLQTAQNEGNLTNQDLISTSLAEAYINNQQFKSVVDLLADRTLDKSSDMKTVDRILNLINLEDAYKAQGDYKNAFTTLNFRKTLQDSIKRNQIIDKIADYEVKYETNRKEAQLKIVSLENQNNKEQKQLFSIIAIGSIIASAVITFLFFTNRKKKVQLEQQTLLLEKTVDEKNVLLKETHHRVKNSFQIVSSLLFLQSKNIKDKEAQLAIKEAQNRVRSMVLIHQKLYSKDDLVGIETKEYFSDLVGDIFESHQDKSQGLQYKLNVESMVLNIETITPIGLILNELIVNVLKHAFSEIDDNNLMQIVFKKQEGQLYLMVSDNGNGIVGEIKDNSFGIKLIKSLVKKLKGSVNYKSELNSGTQVNILIHKFDIL